MYELSLTEYVMMSSNQRYAIQLTY